MIVFLIKSLNLTLYSLIILDWSVDIMCIVHPSDTLAEVLVKYRVRCVRF